MGKPCDRHGRHPAASRPWRSSSSSAAGSWSASAAPSWWCRARSRCRHDDDDERHGDHRRHARRRLYSGGSLFVVAVGGRKYLNAAERRRFVEAALHVPPTIGLFCLTLRWSGARISEVLALTTAAIDIDSDAACIETLKRRRRGIVRQVPLPPDLCGHSTGRSRCGSRSSIRTARRCAYGAGAGRLRGATSKPSWPPPA